MNPVYIAFLALFGIWAIFICFVIRRYITYFNRLYGLEDPANAELNDPFRRKDMKNWNHFEMYFCGIFLLPIRIAVFLIVLILCTIFVKLILIGYSDSKPMGGCRKAMLRFVTRSATRIGLFLFGFIWIKNVKVNIRDIDPSYPEDADNNVAAPVIVSNHVSWVDIIMHMASIHAPGFMAKYDVASYPFIGGIAKGIGSLFVRRDSKSGRDNVVTQLKERLEMVKSHPKTTPKVLLFPEGTTTNGEYILPLKKGAFFQLTPIHITAIKYSASRFNPAYDSIGILAGFILTLCQLYNGVTYYDLGVYNPQHLDLKTEEDWPIYAEKVRGIFTTLLNLKTSERGLHHKLEYEDYCDALMGKKVNKPKPRKSISDKTTAASPMMDQPAMNEVLVQN